MAGAELSLPWYSLMRPPARRLLAHGSQSQADLPGVGSATEASGLTLLHFPASRGFLEPPEVAASDAQSSLSAPLPFARRGRSPYSVN